MEELRRLYEDFKEALRQGKEGIKDIKKGIKDLCKGPFAQKVRELYSQAKKALTETLIEGKEGLKDCAAFLKKSFTRITITDERIKEIAREYAGEGKELYSVVATYQNFNILRQIWYMKKNWPDPFGEEAILRKYILSLCPNEGLYVIRLDYYLNPYKLVTLLKPSDIKKVFVSKILLLNIKVIDQQDRLYDFCIQPLCYRDKSYEYPLQIILKYLETFC